MDAPPSWVRIRPETIIGQLEMVNVSHDNTNPGFTVTDIRSQCLKVQLISIESAYA